MLKENPTAAATQQTIVVLILILMEHAQRARKGDATIKGQEGVLILILMEHAQREHFL